MSKVFQDGVVLVTAAAEDDDDGDDVVESITPSAKYDVITFGSFK